MKVACPSCGKTLKVRDDLAGKRVRCPHCGERLAVEAPGAPASPSRAVARSCPGCRAQMPAGAVVCVQCGLDTRTGRRVAESVSEDLEARRSRKRRLFMAIVVLAIGGVAFGVWYGRHRDDRDFADARQAGTIAAFQAYLASHPSGRHVEQAADEIAFGQARAKGSREAYLAYLKASPNGSHRDEAAELSHPLHAGRLAEQQDRPLHEIVAAYQGLLAGGDLEDGLASEARKRIRDLIEKRAATWLSGACDAFVAGLEGRTHPVLMLLCERHHEAIGFDKVLGWLGGRVDVFLHTPDRIPFPGTATFSLSAAARDAWRGFALRHGRTPVGFMYGEKELHSLPVARVHFCEFQRKTLETRVVVRVGATPIARKSVPALWRTGYSEVHYFNKQDLRRAYRTQFRVRLAISRAAAVCWRSAIIETCDAPLSDWTSDPEVCRYERDGRSGCFRPSTREWDAVTPPNVRGKQRPTRSARDSSPPRMGAFSEWRAQTSLPDLRKRLLDIAQHTDVPALKTPSAPIRYAAPKDEDLPFLEACAKALLWRSLLGAGRSWQGERGAMERAVLDYARKDLTNPRLTALIRGRWGPGYGSPE